MPREKNIKRINIDGTILKYLLNLTKDSGIRSNIDTDIITPLANAKEDFIILFLELLIKKNPIREDMLAHKESIKGFISSPIQRI